MSEVIKIQRVGKMLICPSCKKNLKYSWLSGLNSQVGVYSTDGSSVLVSEKFNIALKNMQLLYNDDELATAIKEYLSTNFPDSQYEIFSNVRCTHCHYEFPYDFLTNIQLRLRDTHIVLIDGIKLVEDNQISVVQVILSPTPNSLSCPDTVRTSYSSN